MKLNRNYVIIGVAVLLVTIVIAIVANQSGASDTTFQTVAAERGSLSASVGATGTVRANQSAELVWQTNGTVENVYVTLGQTVSKGELLANLDRTSVSQNIVLAESELISAQQDLEDLLISNESQAQAELALAQAQDALQDATDKLDSTAYVRASETLIENKESELTLLNKQITKVRQVYNTVANLPDGDTRKAQVISQLTSLELQKDALVAELNWYNAKPDENDVAQRKANYEVAKAQLLIAEKNLARLKDGVDPVALASAEARVAAAQSTLNLARIIAPFNGTVTQLDSLPGDLVSAGVSAARLDDLTRLLVDVEISEIDINDVAVGQPVNLTFDAILGKTYNGTIVEVGRVGVVTQGAVNFIITVELTDADEAVKPGMTAAVSILVKQLDNVLLVPNRAVRFVDGKRVVYVLRDGEAQQVEVRLGSSSDLVSEVIGGDLIEGDLIILNPPTTFSPPQPGQGGQGGGN